MGGVRPAAPLNPWANDKEAVLLIWGGRPLIVGAVSDEGMWFGFGLGGGEGAGSDVVIVVGAGADVDAALHALRCGSWSKTHTMRAVT